MGYSSSTTSESDIGRPLQPSGNSTLSSENRRCNISVSLWPVGPIDFSRPDHAILSPQAAAHSRPFTASIPLNANGIAFPLVQFQLVEHKSLTPALGVPEGRQAPPSPWRRNVSCSSRVRPRYSVKPMLLSARCCHCSVQSSICANSHQPLRVLFFECLSFQLLSSLIFPAQGSANHQIPYKLGSRSAACNSFRTFGLSDRFLMLPPWSFWLLYLSISWASMISSVPLCARRANNGSSGLVLLAPAIAAKVRPVKQWDMSAFSNPQ